ncbi:MAG: nicotinate (nicotinamide) nucleotide adenylyltransferase [Salibacteraceae bacterium]|jgi:nicotinate-nucleotide adenylyltransferase|nr:nicotinate (nicotinamide) nucleotide adenylyltransferase [Salibacteraceae bacterium]MDP4685759.1 nicotinate (nicotinamide) nucleotide adenylyltransferase [Salibacteraceae bacterium]MDP4762474.1 nicotinate (nicotinamide) nucleotide adenylyltransferase [Salibacteraceae bacterium]MDP4843522.1 nicotinate (nicotinamide) nucleotide adenylyltransferase [Salibacteraceae bacterium]MDP4933251.1 nicotinate (nicotinamide) nucleotide adenylyltransferase [Salibacteraceae bacterium]
MKKSIGLYFGTFNPIHVGHLIIANHMVQNAGLDQVWFVVTPQNPLKPKASLLADYHRLALVRIAVDDNPNIEASNVEFDLPQPSYTIHTLVSLSEKYPDYDFTIIMGEDNLNTLQKWKNYEQILNNYAILVYPRVESDENLSVNTESRSPLLDLENVTMIDAPLMKLSASFIRRSIKEGKDVRYLLTEKVVKYIDEMNFYK